MQLFHGYKYANFVTNLNKSTFFRINLVFYYLFSKYNWVTYSFKVFVIKIDGPDGVIQFNLESRRKEEKDNAVSQDDEKRSNHVEKNFKKNCFFFLLQYQLNSSVKIRFIRYFARKYWKGMRIGFRKFFYAV